MNERADAGVPSSLRVSRATAAAAAVGAPPPVDGDESDAKDEFVSESDGESDGERMTDFGTAPTGDGSVYGSDKRQAMMGDPDTWDDVALIERGIRVMRPKGWMRRVAEKHGLTERRAPGLDANANGGAGTLVYTIALRHYHHVFALQQAERLRLRLLASIPRIICNAHHRQALDTAIIHRPVPMPTKIRVFPFALCPSTLRVE